MVAPDDTNEAAVGAEKVLEGSTLRSKMDTLLEEMYCPLERWYLRSSLEKVSKAFASTTMLDLLSADPRRLTLTLPLP